MVLILTFIVIAWRCCPDVQRYLNANKASVHDSVSVSHKGCIKEEREVKGETLGGTEIDKQIDRQRVSQGCL